VSHVRLRSPFPPVLAEAFFLLFVLDEADEKLAADHEAVVVLAEVVSGGACRDGGR
jgi:hypothetical protein